LKLGISVYFVILGLRMGGRGIFEGRAEKGYWGGFREAVS